MLPLGWNSPGDIGRDENGPANQGMPRSPRKPLQDITRGVLGQAAHPSPKPSGKKSPKIVRLTGKESPHHQDLEVAAGAISEFYGGSPLLPSHVDSVSSQSVYILDKTKKGDRPGVVFKPGREAWVKAKIADGLANIFGLEGVVATSSTKTISSLIDKQDIGVSYLRMKAQDGSLYIADLTNVNSVDELEGNFPTQPFTTDLDGLIYTGRLEAEGVCKLDLVDPDFKNDDELSEDQYVLLKEPEEGTIFLVPTEKVHRVYEERSGEYVLRHGMPYRIVEDDDSGDISVVGYGIKGLVQLLVDPLFVGKSRSGLDVRVKSAERDEFYRRIDPKGFVDAMLATLLFAPQDGKLSNLKNESNYLFKLGPTYKPVMIDMDEIFPPNNKFASGGNVHQLRNGLMGMPLAHQVLDEELRKYFRERVSYLLSSDVMKRALTFLQDFVKEKNKGIFEQEQIEAFGERVSRLRDFIDTKAEKPFTLADHNFHIFPEYKEGWDKLRAAGFSPEDCALFMGDMDPDVAIREQSQRKPQKS